MKDRKTPINSSLYRDLKGFKKDKTFTKLPDSNYDSDQR